VKLTVKQLKQIIKEELHDVTADDKSEQIKNTALESIDWVIKYHKRHLQWMWDNFGPNSSISGFDGSNLFSQPAKDASFVINKWKEDFNNPNNRYINLRAIAEKFNFFDEWLSNKPLKQKLIVAIFKTREWQDFHNESLKMIEVIDASSKGKLNLDPKLDEMIASGMENDDLSMVRTAVVLAVDLGLL